MWIEVLVAPDCPRQQLAEERLRQALDDAHLSTTGFTLRVVADQTEAERSAFTGFPTILLDGRDPFAVPSHSCRPYRTLQLAVGAPGLGQLWEALQTTAGTVA